MPDEEQHSVGDTGHVEQTGEQKVDETTQDANDNITSEPADKSVDTQKHDEVDWKKKFETSEERYKNLQSDRDSKLAEKDAQLKNYESIAQQFQGGETPANAQTTKMPTAAELRQRAVKYREMGADFEAEQCEFNAGIADQLEQNNARFQQADEVGALCEQLSHDDSPIKPDQVKWEEVASIAKEQNISPEAAFGIWTNRNLKTLNESVIQQEIDIRIKAGGARGMDSGGDIESEKDDDLNEYRDAIGDPNPSPL